MKSTAKQFTRQYIHDNKGHIAGNVAQHLINNTQSQENGYIWFLTDEEITEYEDALMGRRTEIEIEIESFIEENFNYDISEFEY